MWDLKPEVLAEEVLKHSYFRGITVVSLGLVTSDNIPEGSINP